MSWPRRQFGPAHAHRLSARPGDGAVPSAYRLARTALAPVSAADPLARSPQLARLEAVLFLADEPLTARQLADAGGLGDAAAAARLVAALQGLYEADGSPFEVRELAGGYQLLTLPRYQTWLARIHRPAPELRLTPTLLETLAVVAYKQPITRAEIEAIRGVAVGEPLRALMERGLIRLAGRHPSLGRPQLYATAKKFLQAFGLNTLADLPAVADLPPPAPAPAD